MAQHEWTAWGYAQSLTDKTKRYRIDVNESGALRCECKSFIYSKAPKTCQHVRDAQQEIDEEAKPTRSAPPQEPMDEAVALTGAMLRAAGVVVAHGKVLAMAAVLMPRLASGPALTPSAPAPAIPGGLRLITFD